MQLIDLFRIMDYWVGIPLCFLLTPISVLKKWRSGLFDKNISFPKKILLIKLVEIGAIVHSFPLLKKLHEDYPQTKIYVLTFSRNKEIFELFKDFLNIEEIITINEEGLVPMIKDVGRALLALFRIKVDVALDLEFFTRASALLTLFSGARKTIGFYAYGYEGLYRGNFLSHKVAYNPLQHVTVNYLSLAAAMKKSFKNSPEADEQIVLPIEYPSYISQEKVRLSLAHLGIPQNKRILLMNLGEGNIPLREWPMEYFKQVASSILKNEKNFLLLVGTRGAKIKAEKLMADVNNPRIRNYCGQTNLKQLMEIFLMSEALIANDGGLAHLAMLTPMKKYVFFGPESPQIFAPLGPNTHIFYSHRPCSPCFSAFNHRYSLCKDNQCLKVITPQQVIEIMKI